MGVPSLKIKRALNYRRGYTWKNCGGCDHYNSQWPIKSCNGNPLGNEPRCAVIGLENSRRYRINPNNVCDRHDNTRNLARLTGGF